MEITKVIVASENPGKVAEISALFGTIGVKVSAATGVKYPPEGDNYRTNAAAKARAAARATGYPSVADDSGLEVDALDGRPGVHSARYAPTSEERIEKLLGELRGNRNRRARFRCVAACAFPDGKTILAEETWEGEITESPRGEKGFGYDPVFFDPAIGKTAAEMSPEEKEERSHRGKALRTLIRLLPSSFPS